MFIFAAFTINGIEAPDWWGNSVVRSTLDAKDAAVQKVVGVGEHFGPKVW